MRSLRLSSLNIEQHDGMYPSLVWGARTGPSYTFSEVGPGESGEYYCEARNRIGTHSSPVITVRVRGGFGSSAQRGHTLYHQV